MKVVLDTNVFVSALLTPLGRNRAIIKHWQNGTFSLLTSEFQIDELKRTLNRDMFRSRVAPHRVGSLINLLRVKATIVTPAQTPSISSDPDDNYILAIALTGNADYLASLDMSDVVRLKKVGGTRILHASQLITILR